MRIMQLMVFAMAVGILTSSAPEVEAQTYFDSGELVVDQGCSTCASTSGNRYFGVLGGWIDGSRSNFSLDTAGPALGDQSFGLDLDSDPGFGIGLAVGRRLSSKWRVEGEFVYRNQSLDNLVAEAGGLAGDLLGADPADVTDVVDGISTSLNSYTLAANIIYDFRRGSKINPYLGVGTGVQFVGFNAQESDSGAELTVDYPTVIYQWMAGVSSPLSQNSEVFVEYRGLGTFGTNASASLGNDSVSVGTSLYQGSVFAGFRRDF